MTVPILCTVAFILLGWTVILKVEIADHKKEIERLKGLLKNKLGHLDNQVAVSKGLKTKP
jgi:hypothetical protein